MNPNITVLVYTVTDMTTAKELYGAFLNVAPYVDSPYYVGYKVGNLEVGLTPGAAGTQSPIAYSEVDNIQESIQALVSAGAEKVQDPRDVGGGMLVATVKDTNGNILGLRQQG